ncbi:MAG: tetratricopeptide repeat protein [Fimbriimonas sp.]
MEPNFKTIADLFAVPFQADPTEDDIIRQELEGNDSSESVELGREALAHGDVAKAVEHFRRAIDQNGGATPDDHLNLATAYEFGDQFPQAMRQYIRAKAEKDSVDPLLGLADIYKRYGRWRDAIEQLEAAIQVDPDHAPHHIKLAQTFRDMGERKRALAAAQNAVLANPEEAFYHYWSGDLLIEMKRYDEALESLRAAIELSPGDDLLYLRAAVAFWRTGRRPEAIKAVRLASDLDPSRHLYHGLLGILYDEMDQPEEAHLESDRAKKMDRFDHDDLSRILFEMDIEP